MNCNAYELTDQIKFFLSEYTLYIKPMSTLKCLSERFLENGRQTWNNF